MVEYGDVREPNHSVDWQNVGFTPYPVNGRIQCIFTSDTGAWTEPQWIPSCHVHVHGMSPALNYGQQAFEGLRVFRGEDGNIKLFRLAAHSARFARSAAAVGIPAVPSALFAQAVRLAVYLNSEFVPPFGGGCSMYVRPVIFASSATMNLQPADEYTFIVMVTPVSTLYKPVGLKALVVDGFDRTAPRGTGAFKVGSNYGPTIPVMQRARQKGFALTLHLDSLTRSLVHEFSASGFLAVKANPMGPGAARTIVIPKDEHILPSITVDSIATVAESLGWQVERREIPFKELSTFSEVYTVGTASSMVPISTIIHESAQQCFEYDVKPSSPDSAYSQLNEALHNIKRGIDPEQW
ncbi:branched-chain amino acid aminotransferase, partial [Apiospora kogelbergensis]